MSYFDDASLVMIPSGYKTSKVYSVKPLDGTGDLTFTRSNDTATRVNSAGLIERVRTNLNLYSQDFTNGVYVTGGYGSLASVVANTTANPLNGAQDADTATFTAGGTQSRLLQQFSGLSTANKYTYSIYVKAGTKNTIRIYGDTSVIGVLAEFNLSTGSVVGTPTLCTASIVSAGSGWYRCSITFNAQGAGSADCGPISDAGQDGTLFIYGAQLEVSDFGATDYIATTSAAVSVGPVANVPRLDYLGSSCPRLLLEPQRTNAQTYSEDFSQSKYTKTDCTISSNVTATVDPAGYNGSDKLVEAVSVGGQHYIFFSAQTGANQETQISIFAKAAGRTEFLLWESAITNAQARFNLSNGTISNSSSGNASNLVTTTPTITSYGNGWYRCTLNFKTAAGGGTIRVQLYNGATAYNGNGTDGIYIYGLQEEVNAAYATSYIPTLGAAVTRGADACSKTGISSLIGQTEGTLFVDLTISKLSVTGANLYLTDGTNEIGIQMPPAAPNNFRAIVYNGGAFPVLIDVPFSTTGRYKIAFAYKANDFVIYVNGTLGGSDTSGTLPACSQFGIIGDFNDGINQTLLFKTRLSNADLAALTTI